MTILLNLVALGLPAVSSAESTTNTPSGNIASMTLQSAITELDVEKASLDSPALTGTPTAPTAEPGTKTGQIASTEFVQDAVYLKVMRLGLEIE